MGKKKPDLDLQANTAAMIAVSQRIDMLLRGLDKLPIKVDFVEDPSLADTYRGVAADTYKDAAEFMGVAYKEPEPVEEEPVLTGWVMMVAHQGEWVRLGTVDLDGPQLADFKLTKNIAFINVADSVRLVRP